MYKLLLVGGLLFWSQAGLLHGQEKADGPKKSIYQFQETTIDGKKLDLGKYKGKVLLIVNVASECGYTAQYKGLQELHAKYGKDGLAVLGFPCNDFGGQEPASEAKIKEFAKTTYGVEFDLFSKVKLLGKGASPLYQWLTSKEANPRHAGTVQWNFEKFIIGRDGTIVARFAADVEPDSEELLKALQQALNKK
jgi:glutathione peroxidase